jgi:hypothetical protein
LQSGTDPVRQDTERDPVEDRTAVKQVVGTSFVERSYLDETGRVCTCIKRSDANS